MGRTGEVEAYPRDERAAPFFEQYAACLTAFVSARKKARNHAFAGLEQVVRPLEKDGEACRMQGFSHEAAYGRSRREGGEGACVGQSEGGIDIAFGRGPSPAHLAAPCALGKAEHRGPFREETAFVEGAGDIEA